MMRRIFCALLCATLVVGVAGCSGMTPTEEIKSTTTAFTAEEIAANKSTLTAAERENLVYSYVSNSVKVDSSNLIAVESEDAVALKAKIAEINQGLVTGDILVEKEAELPGKVQSSQSSKSEPSTSGSQSSTSVTSKAESSTVAEVEQEIERDVISESIANYMLYNFSSTPYTWKMTDCNIAGMDAATHLYFVDVTYETTNETKFVLPESSIVKGQPDQSTLERLRFSAYDSLMAANERANEPTATSNDKDFYAHKLREFEDRWGNLDAVVASIKNDSPVERIFRYSSQNKGNTGIGSFAYTGVNNTYKFTGGKVTYRFVLGYTYNIGEVDQLEVKAAYLYNQSLTDMDEILKGLKSDDITGKEILSPLVNKLIYSYNKAMDECDHVGMYSLYKTYKYYDTEIVDYDSYAYHKVGSYLYDIIGRDKDKVYVVVTYNNKERTKGSLMSDASYEEKKLFTIEMSSSDTLKIIDVATLSKDIIGEPLSVIEKVNGVSEQLLYSEGSFTSENEQQVQSVIKKFMELELTHNFDSTAFERCIDIGISTNALEEIKSTVDAMDADEVVTWLTGYTTKSNLYVSVNLREVYSNNKTGAKNETTSVIDLVKRSGAWYVVSYTRTMNAKLNSGKAVSETNCLDHYKLDNGKVTSVKKEVATVKDTSGDSKTKESETSGS